LPSRLTEKKIAWKISIKAARLGFHASWAPKIVIEALGIWKELQKTCRVDSNRAHHGVLVAVGIDRCQPATIE